MFRINLKWNQWNLYLKCDVLLLGVVFEKFRNNSLKNCGLWASHYLSAPGLSWDAMLKMAKIEVGLIPDRDMCYVLRNVEEVKFLMFLIDAANAAKNI